MEAKQNGTLAQWRQDLRSKLLDGIFAGGMLFLLLFVLRLIAIPIGNRFGRLGLLNLDVGVIAIAVFSLDRALSAKRADTTLAWYGAVGGILGWFAIELSCQVGQTPLVALTGVMLFILISLIGFVLWRKGLPVGTQYFFSVLLLCWVAKYVLASQSLFGYWLPVFAPEFHLLGIVSLLCVAGCSGWILFKTQRRQDRTWAALWMCFFSILTLGSFFPFFG